MGRPEEARRSLAWALQVSPASLPLPKLDEAATRQTAGSDLFHYPRSLLVSWLSNLSMQTTGYILWAPTLFVMLLGVSPAQAPAQPATSPREFGHVDVRAAGLPQRSALAQCQRTDRQAGLQ